MMNSPRPFFRWIALVVLLLGSAGPCVAGQRGGYPMLAQNYSLDEVVSGVKRDYRGRVVSADTVKQDGREVHRVRIMNDKGRVRGLRFDGETGEPIRRRDRR